MIPLIFLPLSLGPDNEIAAYTLKSVVAAAHAQHFRCRGHPVLHERTRLPHRQETLLHSDSLQFEAIGAFEELPF